MPWETYYPPSGNYSSATRVLLRAVMGLHSAYSKEIWLWRGQARSEHGLEPAMHSRIKKDGRLANDERNVVWATEQLLDRARSAGLDKIEGTVLPDLALLAHLQHHGAATPLLDVTVDPLVALWMVAFAGRTDPHELDGEHGCLFALRKPAPGPPPLDSRPYGSIADEISDAGALWYQAPDVSERLRIQRGSFVLAPMEISEDPPATIRIGEHSPSKPGWLTKRVEALGERGKPAAATSDVAVFRIDARLKGELRTWLTERAGLTLETVYPTPWHRPFLDEFCTAHGREAPVDLPAP